MSCTCCTAGLVSRRPWLGHASTAVTSKVYTHMLKGADRTAVDAHAAALFPTHDEVVDEDGEEDGEDPVTNL